MRTRIRNLAALLTALCILGCFLPCCAVEVTDTETPPAEVLSPDTTSSGPEGDAPEELPGEGETAESPENGEEENGEAENPAGEGEEEFPEGGEGEFPEGWEGMPEGGFPGGGRRPSGGGRGGFSGGGRGGSQNSSSVTPGQALTEKHASGSGNMMRHGAVALTLQSEEMETLQIGGEELGISCSGLPFTASVEEDVLVLRASAGNGWSVAMDSLNTLRLSGIRQIRLIGPDTETTLDTDLELTGRLYGRERAQGFVSGNFTLLLRPEGWAVLVDGREYRLSGTELA